MGHYMPGCPEKTKEMAAQTPVAMNAMAAPANTQTSMQLLMAAAENGELDDDREQKKFFMQVGAGSDHRSEWAPSIPGDYVLSQWGSRTVDPHWILLDSQSTMDIFYNRKLLRNICESGSWMDIHCNAGIMSTTLVGDLPGYGTVWFHEGGIANILSLARVKDKFTVVFHSKQGNEFHVFGTSDRIRVFRQSERGL